MKIPAGVQVEGGNPRDYVLKVRKNIYGQKQAGRAWNRFLGKELVDEVRSIQSKVDE